MSGNKNISVYILSEGIHDFAWRLTVSPACDEKHLSVFFNLKLQNEIKVENLLRLLVFIIV